MHHQVRQRRIPAASVVTLEAACVYTAAGHTDVALQRHRLGLSCGYQKTAHVADSHTHRLHPQKPTCDAAPRRRVGRGGHARWQPAAKVTCQ